MKAGFLQTLIAAFVVLQLAAPFASATRPADGQTRQPPAADAAAPLEDCNDVQCG